MVQVSTHASPVAPGQIVAEKYRVERVLGVGAMGVVVSARHVTLDRVVAIKFLVTNPFGSREEGIGRFLAEARAAARIDSDHVCRVFDVGTLPDGVPFMVMEHLEGRDLEEELEQRGPFPIVEAVDFVLHAADAVAAAHQLGIVHRDIKPANLFLAVRPDGSRRAKVLDFGISKIASAESGKRATIDKNSVGTPAYMSPEQVLAEPDVDGRADIWALGAILYELLTGQMAFPGDSVQGVLDLVLHEDPCPMTALRHEIPAELQAIVSGCLTRDRSERIPSIGELARALAPFGSTGIAKQLPSLQREIGSISGLRALPPSVDSMTLGGVRGGFGSDPTLDDPRVRESIVQDWTRLRARKRSVRTAMAVLVSAVALVASVGMLLFLRARLTAGSAAPSPPLQAASEPVPSVSASAPAEPGPSAGPSASVYSASNAMQSARIAAPRASTSSQRAGPGKPSKGSVNRLFDSRD